MGREGDVARDRGEERVGVSLGRVGCVGEGLSRRGREGLVG